MASSGTKGKGVWNLFRSNTGSDNKQFPSLVQLNDSVYEFYKPPDGKWSLEIIFIHGLDPGDCSKAYVETWTSFSNSTFICWPQSLLAEKFRSARILSVSYDSSIKRGPEQGNWGLFLIAENLVQDLGLAKVAAQPGIPVILIGKDLGGLVIKAICMEAKTQSRFTFLSNLKGILYYGTPHQGVENLPTTFHGALAETLKIGNEEIARLGSQFSKDRRNRWATKAIISTRSEKVSGLVISEASQRHDVDDCYCPQEGIDRVCKYQTATSSSFQFLTRFIKSIESGDLPFKNSSDQGKTEESAGFKSYLGFGNDGSYVPMETTVREVKTALQKARVVVLHGGPGSGKSSLARYLALHFEAATEEQDTEVVGTCSGEKIDWVPNGVVYMTCGDGAEISSMQKELLRKFDIEGPLLNNESMALEGAVQLQKILHEKLVVRSSKLQFRVVVILDDVWDSRLVTGLLVPGDQVRYLLTTQIPTLWNAPGSKRVQMQDVTPEAARHILGNYANFEGGLISEDLKDVADKIIEATDFHPLALATLGVVLGNMGRTVKDWQELKDNLLEHLTTKDYLPTTFGQQYPLSVKASMMLVMAMLDEDAETLLYKITLFEGPFIPETLLRLFLMYSSPRDEMTNISTSKMRLVAKGLVRIQTHTFRNWVTSQKSSNILDLDLNVLWIHSLRQRFILTTDTAKICQYTNFLDDNRDHKFLQLGNRSNLNMATALCALYGVTDIRKRAIQKMGCHFLRSKEYSRQLGSAMKNLLPLMLSEGDTKSSISQASAEVFLHYVWKRELVGDKISYLLTLTDYPSAPLAILAALADIFSFEEVKLIDEDHFSFFPLILSHLDSHNDIHSRILEKAPSEAPLIQMTALKALIYICHRAVSEKSTTLVLREPSILTMLVGLIELPLAIRTTLSDIFAINALTLVEILARNSEVALQLCHAEGFLQSLVQTLPARDYPTRQESGAVKLRKLALGDPEIKSKFSHLFTLDYPLQAKAATALSTLAAGDRETKSKICEAEGMLVRLVRSLSAHHDLALQKQASQALFHLAHGEQDIKSKICEAEGALAGLVQSLSADDNHALQENAAGALRILAAGDRETQSKICEAEGALTGLVQSLSAHDNPALQKSAAQALSNLAAGDRETQSKICEAEGALTGLVQSLSAHNNHALQEKAAGALCNLAAGDGDRTSKICEVEGVLVALVQSLSAHDNHPLQGNAAAALGNLAAGNTETKSKICEEEGALMALIQSLSAHHNQALQQNALGALSNLAAGDRETKSKICRTKGALAGLVQVFFTNDNHALQEKAAQAFLRLAAGDRAMKSKICEAEGTLVGLVQSLSAQDNHALQENASGALLLLAEGDEEIKAKICEAEGALAGLIQSLSAHDNHPLQENAAVALCNLAAGNDETKSKICKAEGALVGLVQSLSADDNHALQENAAVALYNLAAGNDETKSKICKAEGALVALVQSLSADDNHALQENAAGALSILAAGDWETQSKICEAEGALTGLVQSLSAHNNHALQENAAGALCNLAAGDGDTKSKICEAEGVLVALVQSLSADGNHPLQGNAAAALGNLAAGNAETKSKICEEEGSLTALIQSLSANDNQALQQNALGALSNLAGGDGETKSKICRTEGALAGLVQLFSAHDNHALQEQAVQALLRLAEGDMAMKSKICEAEGALAGLVQSLSAHDNHPLQEKAAGALLTLASGDQAMKSKICEAEGVLAGLVQSLSAHDNHALQENALEALIFLAEGDEEIKSKICEAEGALAGLVQSLSAHNNHRLQVIAAGALLTLASGDRVTQTKICEAEGALAGLVQSLSAHDNHRLQETALGALCNLAVGDGETKSKICRTEGALTGLVQLFSAHDNYALQEKAAKALCILAAGDRETQSKICETEGVLAGLLESLSANDNHALQEMAAGALFNLAAGDGETK